MPQRRRHRMSFGAASDELGGTCFRLWAPAARMVEFIIGPSADGG
jgi:1,4-alpha-glucan branching enzyme